VVWTVHLYDGGLTVA